LNSPPRHSILRGVTNSLKNKSLVLLAAVACGGHAAPATAPAPAPTQPLPIATLVSMHVPVLPLTLIAADDSLHWSARLAHARAMLDSADSVIGSLFKARAPEVNWVLPPELRAQARMSPSFATNPDQLGGALLRSDRVVDIPDPLRSELRTLVAIANARYALVPAALVYRVAGAAGETTAELTVVIVDARLGRVGFRTVARGDGPDPWSALTHAVKALTPGVP
jgi:hypothetical protein